MRKVFLSSGVQAVIRNGRMYILPIGEHRPELLLQDTGSAADRKAIGDCLWKRNDKDHLDVVAESATVWHDKGEIRLECRECDCQHDEVFAIPPGWKDVEEIRSFERATEPAGDDCPPDGLNKHGDSVMDWQTHLGLCPDCTAKGGEQCKG